VAFWRLFYHLVWATKGREPLLVGDVADAVERSLRTTCKEQEVRLIAYGPMPDHLHLVLSIPPRLAVADVVGRLKGAASYVANGVKHGQDARFAWQGEYGVYSFGEKSLPDVVAYVRDQPARHAENRLWPTLEQTTDPS
jgi:putative transposase